MVCFFAFSSAQDQEGSARWTKHHSVCLFCCQPSAWKPPGKAGAAGPSQQSEQRAWGTTYPTGPRSQNPFFKRTRAESQRRPGQLAGTDGWRAVAPLWEQTRAPAQPGRQPEPHPQPGGWEPLGPLCPLSTGPVCPTQTGKTSRSAAPLVLGPWGQVFPSGNSGGAAASPGSPPSPHVSLQMRWLPPSEATSQGWKSRQFC